MKTRPLADAWGCQPFQSFVPLANAERKQEDHVDCMKRESVSRIEEDMRAEYDLSQLRGGVRGKYYRRAAAGTNVVLIEPDLVSMFPNSESVNRALRLLADTARAATGRKQRRKR